MADDLRERAQTALAGISFAQKDLVAAEMIRDLAAEDSRISLALEMPSPAHPQRTDLEARIRAALTAVEGVETVNIRSTWRVRGGESRRPAIPGVKNVIAVASGKGGVGKSTVAVNLAAGLARLGTAVGIADLDVYGPNVPLLLHSREQPHIEGDDMFPSTAHGVRFLSMAQLAPGDKPVLWRGPMLHKVVTQFLQARWGELDYLVLDLPPGTGDVQLTVVQGVPVTGAVVVTTPQEIALIDARKGLTMFRDQHVPILGVVENMAYYACRKCGKQHEIFPRAGGALAKDESVELLARLPLDPAVGTGADDLPVEREGSLGDAFRELAVHTAAALGARSLRKNPFRVLS